jgi:type I restriction enzyme S subunit
MSDQISEQDDLPSSWLHTQLGRVVNYGRTTKVEPSDIPSDAWVLELEDIEKDTSRILQRMTFSQRQSKSTKNKFLEGDVLYGKLRPYLNKVVIADQPGYCTTEIVPINAGLLDNRFLFYWLKHPTFLKYVEAESHGLNMPRLGTDTGIAAPFVLAPREEQTRIADQLDTLLARINACHQRLDTIRALLKRFRQAVMNAAIRGDLVQDRVDRGSQSRSLVSIPDLCLKQKHAFGIGPFGSDLKVADYRESGVPLVFVREIRARKFGDRTTKFVSLEKAAQLSAHRVLPGDLLITKMGDPPGDSAIYPAYGPPAVMTADVVRMRIDPDVADARFVSYWFESEVGRSLIATITAGVAQQKISLERLRTLQIELPNIDEQKTTIQQVESLLELAGHIESAVLAAGARAQRLNSLTLAKAFRGELVPQDPNDEPASVLLAKLKTGPTSAAAIPTRKRSKATGERPKMSNVDQNTIKTVILKLETDRFSFDELREHVAGDYETLKTAIFALLEEPNPVIRQVFDEDAKAMLLVRAKP